MYYKKNRSILQSIKNNKNNKAYFALVVVMLAAICTIAASIILKNQYGKGGSQGNNPSDSDLPSDISNESTAVLPDNSPTTEDREIIPSSLDYTICIMVDEGLIAVYRQDGEGNIFDISFVARCTTGYDVKNYLKGKRTICLSDLYVVPSKSLWKNMTYNDETYYVQFYSMMNGVEFHSALYTENGNNNSVVADSYNAIDNTNIDFISPVGVTLTVTTARWIYENVPGTSDIYICQSYADSPLASVDSVSDNFSEGDFDSLLATSPDGAYMISGKLLSIPSGFHAEPTDDAVNVYCPYVIGSINNVANKTIEFGQIAYSFIEENSTLPGIIFNDVVLLTEDGADVSDYLICRADVSQYVTNQILAMNVNGFLLPGDYIVRFLAADIYGNSLEENCWLNIVDTTAPKIELSREITEINRAQMENPEYILNMVTVTELCKLNPAGLEYTLEEDGETVKIHFTASDMYGNTGELNIELKRVD
ncbi:MAG: hypothetical protein ACI4R6_03350 [Lachnospiraceae bacterium]